MQLPRAVLLHLFMAFVLLFAQQAGAAHALHHALEDAAQHDKNVPHSDACEQCADYAQLGNALGTNGFELPPALAANEAIQPFAPALHFPPILVATARAPPFLLSA